MTTVTDEQFALMGRHIDRLVTVATHAADGSTGRHIMQVDGMPAEVSYAIVTMLGCIVRNGLLTGFKRAF
jgi:hypothetical protein